MTAPARHPGPAPELSNTLMVGLAGVNLVVLAVVLLGVNVWHWSPLPAWLLAGVQALVFVALVVLWVRQDLAMRRWNQAWAAYASAKRVSGIG